MQDLNIRPEWSYWKEGFIYMKGIGVNAYLKKGFMLTEKACTLGHVVAKGDLAYFYYQGIGTEKNLHKALELLKEVNEITRLQNLGSITDEVFDEGDVKGDYERQIELITKEMNK
jgi:hypothetical protein